MDGATTEFTRLQLVSASACPPSLTTYGTLVKRTEDPVERHAFEKAAFASHCGNYAEAEKIYDELQHHRPNLLAALERAQMLENKSDPHGRTRALQLALDILAKDRTQSMFNSTKQEPLLEKFIMLQMRRAEYYGYGRVKPLLNAARTVKRLLIELYSPADCRGFTQLEIFCLLEYFLTINDIKAVSNWTNDQDELVYSHPEKSPSAQLRLVADIMYDLRDFESTNKLLLYALVVTSDEAEHEQLARRMFNLACEVCKSAGSACKFKGLLDLVRLSRRCRNERFSKIMKDCETQVYCAWKCLSTTGFIKELASTATFNIYGNTQSEDFRDSDLVTDLRQKAPRIALHLLLNRELNTDLEPQAYLQMAQEIRPFGDRNSIRACLTKALTSASDAYPQKRDSRTRLLIEQIASECLSLEEEEGQILPCQWFWAFWVRWSYTKDTPDAQSTTSVLQEVKECFRIFVEDGGLDNPNTLHEMHEVAAVTAASLGLNDIARYHREEELKSRNNMAHTSRLGQTPFMLDSQRNRLSLLTNIQKNGTGCCESAEVCLSLLRTWAEQEIKEGSLRQDEWEDIFYAGSRVAMLGTRDPIHELRCHILGRPTSSPTKFQLSPHWHLWITAMQPWLLREYELPFSGARKYVYKRLMQARNQAGNEALHQTVSIEEAPSLCGVISMHQDDHCKYIALLRNELADQVEGGFEIFTARSALVLATIALACQREAYSLGLVNDEVLRQAQEEAIGLFDEIYFDGMEIALLLNSYRILSKASTLMSFRRRLYGTVTAIRQLGLLDRLDKIVARCFHLQIRHVTTPWLKTAGSDALTQEAIDYNHTISSTAITESLRNYCQSVLLIKESNKEFATKYEDVSVLATHLELKENLNLLVDWVQRSKARFFTELLLRHSSQESNVRDPSSRSDAMHTSSNNNESTFDNQDSIHTTMDQRNVVATSNDHQGKHEVPIVPLNHRFQQAESITFDDIQQTLSEIGSGAVFVEWFSCDMLSQSSIDIYIQIHRLGKWVDINAVEGVMMADVKRWCESFSKDDEPFSKDDANVQLTTMAPLLTTVLEFIAPGETLILCPTGVLHKVPMHAILIDDLPLIARNPIVYCQSFSHLRHCFRTVRYDVKPLRTAAIASPLATIYHGSTELRPSAPLVQTISQQLPTSYYLHGDTLSKPELLNALKQSDLFYWHGHIKFKAKAAAALQSAFCLSDTEGRSSLGPQYELTAAELLDIKMQSPALAVIIGCQSGGVNIGRSDTLLGISTSLYFTGATSIVATLWKVRDNDAVTFTAKFFAALQEQKREKRNEFGDDLQNPGNAVTPVPIPRLLDLAAAVQSAVLETRTGKENTPYHWAAFTLSGSWLCPPIAFRNDEGDELKGT